MTRELRKAELEAWAIDSHQSSLIRVLYKQYMGCDGDGIAYLTMIETILDHEFPKATDFSTILPAPGDHLGDRRHQ